MACIGSVRAALYAGTSAAVIVAAARTSALVRYVSGSVVDTP
jgi:hypothetical protein